MLPCTNPTTLTNNMIQIQRRKHCALAVVIRRSQNIFSPAQTPFPGAPDGQNLISWRWSLYLYLQTQFGEDQCTQFRVIVVTDPQTHKQTQTNSQTRPITIHCVAASAQCNNTNQQKGRCRRYSDSAVVRSA